MTLSVYEINPKEHPDAYHGLRVSVQFGGVHHQRYFNFRDKTPREIKQFRADAYALEENWLAEKIKAKIRFDNQANDFRGVSTQPVYAVFIKSLSILMTYTEIIKPTVQ